MELDEFLSYDEVNVVFPKYHDDEIREFAKYMKKLIGNDNITLEHKATCNKNKIELKRKDILYLKLSSSIMGYFGLMLCLTEFGSFIEIQAIKNVSFHQIPKKIRKLHSSYYSFLEKINLNKTIDTLPLSEINLKELNDKLYDEFQELLKVRSNQY